MPGTYKYSMEIESNVKQLLSDMKEAQDRLDTLEGKEYKIKLNVDEKKLGNVISNLEKMLDSLGKGTGDFKQFENLSKELSSIVSEVQSLSKAFGKVDDSGTKTLLSSIQNIDKSLSELSHNILNVNKNMSNMGGNTNDAVKQVENITNESKKATSALEDVAKAQEKVNGQKTNISSGMKDAFPKTSDTTSVEKIADGFKDIKQETEKATESAKEYGKILSQVGLVSKKYNDKGEQIPSQYSYTRQTGENQVQTVTVKFEKDKESGEIVEREIIGEYITGFQALEKEIDKADKKIFDLKKNLESNKIKLGDNYNTSALDKLIEDAENDANMLYEALRRVYNEQSEYEYSIAQYDDERAKKQASYNTQLENAKKIEEARAKNVSDKKDESAEKKRQDNITQTNRLLNKQQILIDEIEKTYKRTSDNPIDKAVDDTKDLEKLTEKKAAIKEKIDLVYNKGRNSTNEETFLEIEQLISEYKQLAAVKLKANNPSKQELGGQKLDVLLSQQVAQYNQLITKAEKYGNATSDIVEKLKAQRDLIAQANSDGIYTAKSGLKADDYYSARDNYKIGKAQFSSYETDIKNTEKLIQAQKELGEATTKARQSAKDATQSSVDNALKDQVAAWKNIQFIREKIAKTKDTNEIANLQQVKKEYQQNYIEADRILKSNSSLYDKEIQLAKLEQIRVETNKKIADYQDKQISGYDNRLESYTKKTSGYNATIARFNDGGWTSDEYLKNVQAVKDAVKKYEDLLSNIKTKGGITSEEDVQKLKEYESEIKKTISTVTNMSAAEKGYNFVSAQKELDKIHKLLNENSKMSSEAKAKIQAYYAEIESGNPSMSLDRIHGEIMKIYNAEVEAGRAGRSFFDTLKNSGFHQIAAQMAGMFGIYDVINVVKEGINTVRELDTAMTEVRKVSDATEAQYASFQKTISSTAKEIASTNKELLNSSADFLRLGYSLDQTENLAKNATLFVNVGDGVDINEATEDMITAMKAFDIQAEDSIKIVDDYNQIGNKFALSATDIGEAMKRSASALETGNNSFEESIALITAMNEIVQNSENTGNTLKVFSLRLRGAKAELEAMSEDTDGLCESSSKLREQLQALTGVDIMVDDNTFKSTTQIVKELGAVWNKLSDSSQAATLELIAGKTRANNVAALLKNYQQIDNVLESLGEAEGSALRENDAIVDSINGRIKILSASAEEFWKTFIDTDLVKNTVSLLSDMLNILTQIIDKGGALGTLGIGGAGVGIGAFIKNFSWLTKSYKDSPKFLVG